MKPKYLLFASFGVFVLIQFLFSLGLAPLADDVVHYNDLLRVQKGEINAKEVFSILFNDPNRYTRPMSSIILGTMTIISSLSENLFFLWGIFYIPLFYLSYKILLKYFGSKWFSLLVVLLIMLFPLSSSNLYSPVLHTGQFAVFSFLISILLSNREKIFPYIIICILSTLTLLFYEMNLFLSPIVIALIWVQNKEKKYLKIFLATILPIVLAFVYKTYFVKILYPDYFDYSSSKIYLGVDKIGGNIIAFIKLFFLDYPYITYKSIMMIKAYSILDFILLLLGTIISITLSLKIKAKHKISNIYLIVSILFFLLTIFVFFISQYPAVAFGFENRILLWVRFSSMLLLGIFLYNSLYWSREKRVLNIMVRSVLCLILFSFFTSVISQKNSWILASKYNENVIENLSTHFQENQEDTKILYVKDYKKREFFITDESTLSPDYEVKAALEIYSNSNLQAKNILFFNPTYYSLYNIGNIELNKRPKTGYELTEKGIKIGKRELSFPFYIFDERNNSIIKVNNPREFRIK